MARIEVRSEVTGSVWKIEAAVGTQVAADEPILLIESMKMEIPVCCESAGTVVEIFAVEGESVEDGEVVAIVQT